MGRIVVTQPDGKHAIFSTIIDDFILYDATRDELIEFLLNDKRREVENFVNVSLKKENRLGECLETVKHVHGKDTFEQAKEELGVK